MIIAHSWWFKLNLLFHKATIAVIALIAAVLIGMGSYFILYPWENGEKWECSRKLFSRDAWASSYESIGMNALSLNANQFSDALPNLSQEILVLSRNSRPDRQSQELLIALKASKQEKIVANGEILFLDVAAKNEEEMAQIAFTAKPASLWIKPILLDKTSVLIEEGSGEKKTQFIIQESSGKKGIREEAYFKSIKGAKCWGPDLLLKQYGGDEYRLLQDKQKIEFPEGNVCFVKQGDYLSWVGDRWTSVSLEEASPKFPLARIGACRNQQVEVEAWDASGFYPLEMKWEKEAPVKMNYRSEEILSSIRLRTSSAVTCVMGKRRLILKKGDWLLRSSQGWHKLKSLEDIENCLQHELRGELFIFDGVKKEGTKATLLGHLFDPMRTQVQPITIPIVAVKKPKDMDKKK